MRYPKRLLRLREQRPRSRSCPRERNPCRPHRRLALRDGSADVGKTCRNGSATPPAREAEVAIGDSRIHGAVKARWVRFRQMENQRTRNFFRTDRREGRSLALVMALLACLRAACAYRIPARLDRRSWTRRRSCATCTVRSVEPIVCQRCLSITRGRADRETTAPTPAARAPPPRC